MNAVAETEQGVTFENRTQVEWMEYRTGQYLRRAGVMVVNGPEGRVSCIECQHEWQPARREDGRFLSWACPKGCSRERVAALDALGLKPVRSESRAFPLDLIPVVTGPALDMDDSVLLQAFREAFVGVEVTV